MRTLWRDLRYGVRMLLRRPGFTTVAVLTLALGIGANTTIFSFVNGILLRPLPYAEPERLALIEENALKRGVTSMGVSFPNFLDWRERNQVFEDVATYQTGNFSLTGAGEPEQFRGARISAGLLEILRVPPTLGRTFTAEEDRPEQNTVVILGNGVWQNRFGGDSSIVGQQVVLNNRSHTVIGVMPPGFKFPEIAELWVPLALTPQSWTRNDHGLGGVARLKAGVSFSHAQSEMDAIAQGIEAENPITNDGLGVRVTSMHERLSGDYSEALMVLLGTVGCVLLVACANVANLLLARATARKKEIAVRTALGASRGRMVRQLLTESLLLGAAGGTLGLVLAVWGLELLLAMIPVDLPFWMNFDLDLRVLSFTLGISLLTGVIFGVVPALQASRADVNETLKEGGRSAGTATSHRARNLVVVAEVALSLVVLVAAGLMMQSFLRLRQVNSGVNPRNVLTLALSLPTAKYGGDARAEFVRRLMESIRTLPGVDSAGATSGLPLGGGTWGRSLTVEGYPVLAVGQAPMIQHNVITPDYFRALGIPILTGRDFNEADSKDATRVTIVDERLAREYWPNESPLGKRVRFGPPENNEPWHTIVGVAGAVRHERLDTETRQSVYLPHLQNPVNGIALTVRSQANPTSLIGAVRSELRELDPNLPVTRVRTMEEVVSQSIWQPRLYTILLGLFAAVALLLACVGIYGVMSYSVAQRTHEIGIRMALGASSMDVLKLVISQGIKPALVGVAIGMAGAFGLTHLMSSLLFTVNPTDPVTFGLNAILLTSVATVACWLPARRATKVDPMIALRGE
jgi:putative ABC transport system permease protein